MISMSTRPFESSSHISTHLFGGELGRTVYFGFSRDRAKDDNRQCRKYRFDEGASKGGMAQHECPQEAEEIGADTGVDAIELTSAGLTFKITNCSLLQVYFCHDDKDYHQHNLEEVQNEPQPAL